MSEIITVGIDLAKNVFQALRADGSGRAVLRKKPRRAQMMELLQSRWLCLKLKVLYFKLIQKSAVN